MQGKAGGVGSRGADQERIEAALKELKVDQSQRDAVILPRSSSGVEPQHLLLALLGEHWFRRSEAVPSAALVQLLADFGVEESSARQSMRRLAARGLLVPSKNGRTTAYGYPERSEEAIEARVRQVVGFGFEYPAWDGRWTIVSFSVPEHDREARRTLRNQLRALRFGMLHDAVWIHPNDQSVQANMMLDQLGIKSAHVFRATHVPREVGEQSINDVFGLESLEQGYRDFIDEYSALAEGRQNFDNALVARTKMVNKWLTFRTQDPDIPAELLPNDWPRKPAHQVFLDVYDRLGPAAEARFREIVAETDEELSKLASHHTSQLLTK